MPDAYRNLCTIEDLRRRYIYDPNTGHLFSKRAGRKVGAIGNRKTGYLVVWIAKRRFLCHRVAWAMHYGHWVEAPAEIDHINGITADNRIANLRMVSRQMQMRNLRLNRTNKSGTTGVSKCNQTGMWSATITVNRKQVWLGRHETLKAAVAARKEAEQQYGWPT